MNAPHGDFSRPSTGRTGARTASGWKYACVCLTAAVLLHFLPAALFRIAPAKTQAPVERHRNILIDADKAEFQEYIKKLPETSDPAIFVHGGEPSNPAIFVHGGKTPGYSAIRRDSDSESPDAVAISTPPLFQPEPVVFTPEFFPEPRQIGEFPADPFLYFIPPETIAVKESGPFFPRWTDADGKRMPSPIPAGDAAAAELTKSRDIKGPTILEIDRRFAAKKLPPSVRVRRSCGNYNLDVRARNALEKTLLNEYNSDTRSSMVRIDWRADVPGIREESFPDRLFPDLDGGTK